MKKYLKIIGVVLVSAIATIGVIYFIQGQNGNIIKTNNLKLTSFHGNCDDTGPAGKPKILKRNFISADTMNIKVQTEVTCCVYLKGDIEIKDGNIINLKYKETGESCKCLCKGILDYTIKGVDKRKYQFQLNGEELTENFKEINNKDQYEALEDKCNKLDVGQEDCLEAIEIMQKNNYEPAGEKGCLEGFVRNGLDCIGCEDMDWCEPSKTNIISKQINKHNYISSTFCVQGKYTTTFLSDDRTFIKINTNFMMSEVLCIEGQISEEDYNSFWSLVESSNFLKNEFEQQKDLDILCEGVISIGVSLDGKRKSLSPPCVQEYSEETNKIIETMEMISHKLEEVINKSNPKVCKKGIYMETSYLGKCEKYLALDWNKDQEFDVYDIYDLDTNLKKSLNYIERDIYLSDLNQKQKVESYHRKYYRIGNDCYFVFLNEFDGKEYRSYDEVLNE